VNPNAILVSRRQEGNPLLRHIRSVRWQYADIVPDYQMGAGTCALFLSLRSCPASETFVHMDKATEYRIMLLTQEQQVLRYDVLCYRFHLLKPEYVHHRIKQMQRGYRLRIILCHVDIEDVVESLNQVWRHVMHMEARHSPGLQPFMSSSHCSC
jgi:DNA excision repair protein ERCC-1